MLSRILTIGLLGLMFCTTACSSTAPHPKGYETYVAKGDKFKDMTLTSIQGDTVSFDQNKKKLIVLFATWCSDSKRTLRELKASPLISDPTLEIIAIGREESTASLSEFKDSFGVPFTLVADPDKAIYSHYANKGIPRLILLDEQNRVIDTWIGETPDTVSQIKW
ncbi:TlpA family protein disulfide reductase [Pseudoalteromonas xiamenensis]|uniref:TlpA family protein disulfide reductase n=1 Tax=Pseudoalteromonas xiamenensis TaxID=882626 RepID=A0A975HJU8_9GAMM|nr:TlpA disulfide reductase family protein [Pseudoalteromonas xiamenensis]QTH70257.1 TlpA family protein disulfide reductase [Pseudoalteromonas xiamenensis]